MSHGFHSYVKLPEAMYIQWIGLRDVLQEHPIYIIYIYMNMNTYIFDDGEIKWFPVDFPVNIFHIPVTLKEGNSSTNEPWLPRVPAGDAGSVGPIGAWLTSAAFVFLHMALLIAYCCCEAVRVGCHICIYIWSAMWITVWSIWEFLIYLSIFQFLSIRIYFKTEFGPWSSWWWCWFWK